MRKKRNHWTTVLAVMFILVFCILTLSGCKGHVGISNPNGNDDPQAVLDSINHRPWDKYSSARQSSSISTPEFSSSSRTYSSSASNINSSSSSKKNSSNPWENWNHGSSSSSTITQSSSSQISSSSSSKNNPTNPWENWNHRSSSSKNQQVSSSSKPGNSGSNVAELNDNTECQVIRNTTDKFSRLQDILPCVKSDEKVAFIIRHAARNKSASGDQAGLNDEGRTQSKALGEELKDIEDIYFMNTKVYRTMETVLKIVEGKGQSFSESKVPFQNKEADDHLETSDMEDTYLVTDDRKLQNCRNTLQSKYNWSWGWSAYSYIAFEEKPVPECKEAFFDIDERLEELIDTHFTYDKMHPITMAISHDKLLVPLVIAASNRQINLKFHQHENDFNYWINYLTGIAIIVDQSNNRLILPTTALKDPILRVFPDN